MRATAFATALALFLPVGARAGGSGEAAAASPAEVGLTAAGLPAAPGPGATPLGALLRQADDWLLAGRMAPPDLPRMLDALAPADRLTALAHMRRSGVYDGPALDLAALLAPAEVPR